MQCPNCHAPLKPGATVCDNCGSPITPPAGATSTGGVAPRAVAEPTRRLPPAKGKAVQAIFMDFNQSPREIVQVMTEAQQQAQTFLAQKKRQQRWLWLLFPAGLPFLCADVWLGYNFCTFSLVALTLWGGAIFGLIWMRRQGQAPQFGPRFDLARTIFDTLKDDISSKHTMVGWLDLTGAEQDSKKIREKNSQSGQPIFYYHDDWLRLKTRLYDGNVLRLAVIDRVKARQGFWKRSRVSGKNKWRGGSSEKEYELQFSVSVSLDTYEITSIPLQPGAAIPNSRFVLDEVEAGEGRLSLNAVASSDFDAWDVLNVLRFGYQHVQAVSN